MEAILVSVLAPCLPYLLTIGGKLADKASDAIGSKVWECGQALWDRLSPSLGEREAAEEAARDVAASPDDELARGALQLQLRKILQNDESLREQVSAILDHAKDAGVVATDGGVVISGGVRADRGGIAAGRDINPGGNINTGFDTRRRKE